MIAALTGRSADEAERNTTKDSSLQFMRFVYCFCCSESTLCHRFFRGTRRLAEIAGYLFDEAAE